MKPLNKRSCLIYVEKRTGRLHLNFKVSSDQTLPVSQQLDAVRKLIGMEWIQLPYNSLMIYGTIAEVTQMQIILKNWTIQGGVHE